MHMGKVLKAQIFSGIKVVDEKLVNQKLAEALNSLNKKIVVLDDDPTGVQTVHDISVYTDWEEESIAAGFAEDNAMFFILTNSRAFSAVQTHKAHKEMAERIAEAAQRSGKDFMIISRSDSTLRGHYPLETQTLKETIEMCCKVQIDGEVLMPFFKEGGRFTVDNIHYVQEDEYLIPAGETEFAQDKTFGYQASNLGAYVEEKTQGAYKAKDTTYISLESIRNMDFEAITRQLMAVEGFNKIVVNAVDYVDVKVFAVALIQAMAKGKNFMFRTAAAFTKVIGGVCDKALLTKAELVAQDNQNGGLVIVGSHVKKTTEQLAELQKCDYVKFIAFNHLLVLEPTKLEQELDRIISETESWIKNGQTVTVFTGRERLDAGSQEESLQVSVKISEAITSIVQRLNVQPSFLIAKGGITSSDVGTKGLAVKKAKVLGQVKPGIPVWQTGLESKFPKLPYIIFPGNVGAVTTLREIVVMLNDQ